jgi:hypothetical protein
MFLSDHMVIRRKSATTFFHYFHRKPITLHYNCTKIKCSQTNIFFFTSQNYNNFQCEIFIETTTKCGLVLHIFKSSLTKRYKFHEIAYGLWCPSVLTINKIIFMYKKTLIKFLWSEVGSSMRNAGFISVSTRHKKDKAILNNIYVTQPKTTIFITKTLQN